MRIALLSSLLLCACATGLPSGARAELHTGGFHPFSPAAPRREIPSDDVEYRPIAKLASARDAIVSTARSLVGKSDVVVNGKKFSSDCSGLVVAAYQKAGLNLLARAEADDNAVTAIYRYAAEHGRVYSGGWPVAGDLVFFRETYDQNRDGRANDGLTHIGLVDGVDSDGTIRVVHRVKRGVVVYRMNLQHPDARTEPKSGRTINDYLRASKPGQAPALTAQLFAGYATLLPAK